MQDLGETLIDFVSAPILWGIFMFVLLAFAVISTALMYHWRNYNVSSIVGKRIRRAYFLVSGIFIFVMLVSLIAYST